MSREKVLLRKQNLSSFVMILEIEENVSNWNWSNFPPKI